MLVCDTSGLVAYFDVSDSRYADARSAVDDDPGPFVVSPYVLAELDYLLSTRRGVREELVALTELAGGAWDLPRCDEADVRRALGIIDMYRDQNIGLTDASLVVLAARYRTNRLLTLDHRHFLVVRTATGKPFTLLP